MLTPVPLPSRVLSHWSEVLTLIQTRSVALRTAVAETRAASAEVERALAAFYPLIQAQGNAQRALLRGTGLDSTGRLSSSLPDPATTLSASVSLRQPILNLSTWHDHRTAELSTLVARERETDARRLVLGAVASAIVGVVTAERLAEVSRVGLGSALSSLELTRRRAELGASSQVDVLRAQQEVALNRAQIVASTESLVRAREALGLALGFPEPIGVSPEINLDALSQDAAQVCHSMATNQERADVRAARLNVAVATRASTRATLQTTPRLDLNSDFTATTRPITENGKPLQWSIGAILTIPIYDGGVRYAARLSAAARTEQAAAQLEQVSRQSRLDVAQADRSVRVAAEALSVSTQSRDLAKEAKRLAELSFINGRGTNFELVDAQRRLQQAELDLAVKEFEGVRAQIAALLARADCAL
jgi:outer membrane protein TolC